MKITDFLNNKIFSLPSTQAPKEDYQAFIKRKLKEYLSVLNKVESFEDISFDMESIKSRQNYLVSQLNLVISSYYDGKPASALEELANGLKSNEKDFEKILNIREFEKESDFYRMRICKENFPLPIDEFFHIPYNLRGIIKTQRFSIPGFPSLYLGTSSYVCWEELGRPNLNDFQIVRLNNKRKLRVIDLSPPPKRENIIFESSEDLAYESYKYLMIWPLVFTCSVKVRNTNDYFKPEYIVPQLLLQWVRKDKRIDGIAYQTTHINLNESLSLGEFLNIVLPVIENKNSGLCRKLDEKFLMTESTSVQLNQCSTNGEIDGGSASSGSNKTIQEIELTKGVPTNYGISIFGELEEILDSMQCKKIIK